MPDAGLVRGLKPYPAYKDSEGFWLDRVPVHWEMRRIKWIAIVNPSRSEARQSLSSDIPLTFLPMEHIGTYGQVDSSEYKPTSALWNGFTYFRRGDVLIAKITPCFENGKGACLDRLPTSIGFGSTEFHVLRARSLITPQYLYRVTTIPEFRRLGADAMTGAAGQQRVPQSFVDFPITIPQLSEQLAIVRFTDYVDRRIRRYIRSKQKLIALLNEQKQAIIHRAVTRRLDPNVRLKPSGVEWLGSVPDQWEIRRAKYFFREVDERSTTGIEELLSVSHITGITPRNRKNVTMFMAASNVGHKLCRPGDLAINTMWAWMGALGISRYAGIVSPSYAVYRPLRDSKLLSHYIDLLLRTRPFVAEYFCRSTGIRSSRLRLYPEQFLRIKLPCPPTEEQRAIVRWVGDATVAADRAIVETQGEIDMLREYRTRLIADVAKGKLDVRGAAAHLPDETQEAESIGDSDALSQDEEELENADLGVPPEEAEA